MPHFESLNGAPGLLRYMRRDSRDEKPGNVALGFRSPDQPLLALSHNIRSMALSSKPKETKGLVINRLGDASPGSAAKATGQNLSYQQCLGVFVQTRFAPLG